jgi:hypothetical protein
MVWFLVRVLLVFVGSVISLDSYLLELQNIVCNGQNEIDIWTWIHPLEVCIRKHM